MHLAWTVIYFFRQPGCFEIDRLRVCQRNFKPRHPSNTVLHTVLRGWVLHWIHVPHGPFSLDLNVFIQPYVYITKQLPRQNYINILGRHTSWILFLYFPTAWSQQESNVISFGPVLVTWYIRVSLFLAPEVLGPEKYDKSCDIWSLGVIMYIL